MSGYHKMPSLAMTKLQMNSGVGSESSNKKKLDEYTISGTEEKVDRDKQSLNNRFKRHIQH